VPPHLLDLVLEGGELHPLAGRRQLGQCGENLVEMKCLVALLDAVRVHHPITPLDSGFEPPGLAAVMRLQLGDVG
jgi:hypothetical protein